jgi:hypothetical protein
MKTIILIWGLLLLSACTATEGTRGYSEEKMGDDHYRIELKRTSKSVDSAGDYALLKAAELTQKKGYDWFVVTHKETLVESKAQPQTSSLSTARTREVERNCGLLTCETRVHTMSDAGTGFSNNTLRKEVHITLDIKMGKGVKLNEQSLSAQDILNQQLK